MDDSASKDSKNSQDQDDSSQSIPVSVNASSSSIENASIADEPSKESDTSSSDAPLPNAASGSVITPNEEPSKDSETSSPSEVLSDEPTAWSEVPAEDSDPTHSADSPITPTEEQSSPKEEDIHSSEAATNSQTTKENSPAASSEAPVPPVSSMPQDSAPENSASNEKSASDKPVVMSKKSNKPMLFIIIIIVLLLIAVAVYLLTKNKTQKTVTVNKDIPSLSYAFSDSGDVTPNFPLENADTTNTILIDSQLFESLVAYKDQTKVVPALATGWSNPDQSTWVFNLRHNVKFHDGHTLTAADVKYSFDYAIAHQGDYNGSTIFYLASTFKTVSVVNNYQVKITTTQPDAELLNRLASGLYVFSSKAKLGDPNAGTGPYIVKPGSIKPKATTLDLQAFTGYWGGHIYTRAVHIVEEPTIDQMAKNAALGKYDVSGDFDAKQVASIKSKVSGYRPIVVPDLGTHYLNINTENASSPLHSLQARQAFAYALNIPNILNAAQLTGKQASQLIPSELPGYDPSIKNVPYDPAKAKQLLSGVANLSTPLNLYYPTGDEAQMNEVAKELDAVGFTIKLTSVGDLSALVNRITAGQGDIFFLGYSSNTLDGLDIVSTVVAGTKNYSNPELDGLISQAGSTIDPTSRIATLQKMEQIISKDIPTVPLYEETRTYALTKPYVTNIDLPAIDSGLYFWQVHK